ncbi:hypothetical protein E8K88_10915 [Lampropedia aestuarii]|uniref:Uncharacterized protein n=1 Tax=Lampropedia aestuarii TaxID=2562762 RepID=A0A4S5BPC3_9BURK|nr:hypothetical protein [Lampropedia aestuarii]THJ32795.1 hypothetical protein E8K88_10915 [Lampropedia aestuarii]
MADETQQLQELRQALAQLLCERFEQEDLTRTLHRHFKGALTALDKHLSQTACRVDTQDAR